MPGESNLLVAFDNALPLQLLAALQAHGECAEFGRSVCCLILIDLDWSWLYDIYYDIDIVPYWLMRYIYIDIDIVCFQYRAFNKQGSLQAWRCILDRATWLQHRKETSCVPKMGCNMLTLTVLTRPRHGYPTPSFFSYNQPIEQDLLTFFCLWEALQWHRVTLEKLNSSNFPQLNSPSK